MEATISEDYFTFDLAVEKPNRVFYFIETNKRYHLMAPDQFYESVIVDYDAESPETPEGWVKIHDRFILESVKTPKGLDFESPVEGVLPSLEEGTHQIQDLNGRTYDVDKTGAQLASAVSYYDLVAKKLQHEGEREKAEAFQKVLAPLHYAAMAYSTSVAHCLN
ncbi:hypothetical protein [Salinibacter ruber]|jgi:hypothetical protein|uniref:hypothetical protein n=1 Tax=Salinibacter ruber TaxID=146919 RepID=UPI0020736DC3|nr:hypothetical protein [Salinibacter ruber]